MYQRSSVQPNINNNGNNQGSVAPTLQHPKPVPPPFAMPASPPIPDSPSAQSNSNPFTPHQHPHHQQQRTAIIRPSSSSSSSPDYQRFTSPPSAVTQLVDQTFYQSNLDQSYNNTFSSNSHGTNNSQHQQPVWSTNNVNPNGTGNINFQSPFGVNDVTTQMGIQFGQSAMRAGSDYVEKNLIRYLPLSHLKHSFNVSNLYVFNKIKLVLFPWRHKPWSRLVRRSEVSGQIEGYKPPREDINCPDTYIPVMALMTYILLSGAVAGSKGRFDPELLSIAASQALGIIFLEFCCIKLGCYLLNVSGDGAVIDLLSYSGYKFVGIIVNVLASSVGLKSSICWVVFIYVFCSNAFFLLRSLRYVILPDPAGQSFGSNSTSTVSSSQKSRRIQFLFAISVSQFGSMWLLSRV
ncbi:YIF1-domain-containing protein [Phakopsora pachyrhizi]|uniref:YIF1-domain-containing protein n=1 Tax=Phakopsora pachyrhizi TaxID=170000 RepID=A0AAV0AWU2_PHAPC|nr:YIF1-domain-containing protein [Phakopsora pachyrhizi]KAI8453262.1 YIF1-domain-containing protein [Phakopsora pachyrhizi]CAH7672921.1 YIF1-domain-containing protein [Phakopsora pachyrhizi]